ncbi:MAG TPA: hypothetical protein VFP58_08430, partial [Candidatus Eisenbacteria bacterium]|nr:hypothetical protein [Candidatus Eisenbacteria bacterium]
GLAYGLGLQFKQLNLDYAMTPNEDFDNIHRLSFGYSFGTGAPEKEPKQPKPEEPKQDPEPSEPKGPRVIAQGEAPSPKAPAPKPAAETPKPASKEPVVAKESKDEAALAAAAGVPAGESKPAPAPDPAPAPTPAAKPAPIQYAVVMPGYPSKDSAEAEMKALELLGFRTKDAQIVKDPKRGGYMIAFSKLKSKGNAEEMASNLQRMSFRAHVEVAQK